MCKIRFITIGYIEWRKGQDLLVDAIKRLPSEMIDITEFIFVGQNTSRLAGQLLEKTKDLLDSIHDGNSFKRKCSQFIR